MRWQVSGFSLLMSLDTQLVSLEDDGVLEQPGGVVGLPAPPHSRGGHGPAIRCQGAEVRRYCTATLFLLLLMWYFFNIKVITCCPVSLFSCNYYFLKFNYFCVFF